LQVCCQHHVGVGNRDLVTFQTLKRSTDDEANPEEADQPGQFEEIGDRPHNHAGIFRSSRPGTIVKSGDCAEILDL
jgi:hypothetical protein